MCGRFFTEQENPALWELMVRASESPLAERFRERFGQSVSAGGEIAPAAVVPAVASSRAGNRAVFPMKWGFTLPTRPGASAGRLLINARTETAAERPAFRDAWKTRRCVIPASGYYEWEHLTDTRGKKKTGRKYAIRPEDCPIAWLAGLYRMEEGLPVFVILTRPPSEDVIRIHDRMPLILPESAVREWIRPDADPAALLPQARTRMICEEADRR